MLEITILLLIFNSFPVLSDINYNNRFFIQNENKIKNIVKEYKIAHSDINYTSLEQDLEYKAKYKVVEENISTEKFNFKKLTAIKNITESLISKSFTETTNLANWKKLREDFELSKECEFNTITSSSFIECEKITIKNLSSNLIIATTGEVIIENLNAKNIQVYSFKNLTINNFERLEDSILFTQLGKTKISDKELEQSCNAFSKQDQTKQSQILNCYNQKKLEYLIKFRPVSTQLY